MSADALHRDVVIVGGGLSGLTAAHVLSHVGLRVLVVEKAPVVGGGCRSFQDDLGNTFDAGFHAIDEGRNTITTRLFEKVLKDDLVRFEMKRGIVLRDSLLPYSAPLSEWPADLRALFDAEPAVDDISGDLTRGNIARVYGRLFADFAFDEILRSYPSKVWALERKAPEHDHIDNVYPWFFPRVPKKAVRSEEWNSYHDKVREQPKHYMLYPKTGGFGGLTRALVDKAAPGLVEIEAGVKDLRLEHDEARQVKAVHANGRRITADLYLWCTSPAPLLAALGKPAKIDAAPQRLVEGNFAFAKPTGCPYHEIIVGSLQHKINRVAFPAKMPGKPDTLVQAEFYFPEGEFPNDPAYWREQWLPSLRKLGIVKPDNEPLGFHFVSEIKGFATMERFDVLTRSFKDWVGALNTNMRIPYYNLGPENASRVMAGTVTGVADLLKTFL